ncbi:MAG: UbiA family prenyltransferase [Rhodospirillaceae bacterium]|nr:UbiA family prenyltransferase [Rhodospirillales bacterium]
MTFSAILLPRLAYGDMLEDAFTIALPSLFLMMAIFVLNDFNDRDKDAVNSPKRPIPSMLVSDNSAILLYFTLLFASMASILYIDSSFVKCIYFSFAIIGLNYDHANRQFPAIKNLYVACCFQLLTMLVVFDNPNVPRSILLCAAIFIHRLGIEMSMDIVDMKGDGRTIANIIGASNAVIASTALRLASAIAMIAAITTQAGAIIVALIFLCEALIFRLWRAEGYRRSAILVMKGEIALGVAFLSFA